MKSRNLVALIIVGLASADAYAVYTDTNSTGKTSAWEDVTKNVKNTVNKWVGYWDSYTNSNKTEQAFDVEKPVATKVAQPEKKNSSIESKTSEESESQNPISVSEEGQNLRKQSLFATKGEGSTIQEIREVAEKVKAASVLKVATPGRAGTSQLTKTNGGVPVVDWKKLKSTKKIPRLDIGTESLISREEFSVSKLQTGMNSASEVKKLSTPSLISDSQMAEIAPKNLTKALGSRGLLANIRTVGKPLSMEQVQKVAYKIVEVPDFNALPYRPLSDEQMKMLAALILFDRGDHCHMIMGLFYQLKNDPKNNVEATYHLGACAADLKMDQSAFDNLTAVISSEDSDYSALALGRLAKGLPQIYEKDFYAMFKRLKNSKSLLANEKIKTFVDEINYRLAKGAYRAGEFKASGALAQLVPETSTYSDDAQFLSGMNSFALGDKKAALNKLQALWSKIEPRKSDANSNIRALTSLNLARMYFAQSKFDKAFEHYMQVPKDHPLWVKALIEQGWTQIALEDYSGAIGNMYSLHSPYFKAVYQPESFVVRTIGYLNICQYGDAYKSLSFIEKDYRKWYSKVGDYLSKKGNPTDIYATVRNYIRGKSSDDVEGVPFQVWREMAHQKDFLNLQSALNDKLDENRRYNGVNTKIKDEKASIRSRAEQSKARFDKLKNQLAKARTDKSLQKEVDTWNASLRLERDLTIGYRYQLTILELSRQGYLEFQKKSQVKLDNETDVLSTRAGQILLGHATGMQKKMSRVLDNNEFLRYEVFSGSGENIRYEVAGGEVAGPNRIPASIRPKKMLNWSFDGEFWEDEIGNYRSSLHNNCPDANPAAQAKLIDDEN